MKAVGSSDRVFELLDKEPDMNIEGGITLRDWKGEIRFKKVDFAYPAQLDIPILENFSLTLEPNKVAALVGTRGSGKVREEFILIEMIKSKVVRLILCLYDPHGGEILLDGVNISKLDLSGYIKCCCCQQEPLLFNTSIRENISYGRMDATQEVFLYIILLNF